MEKPVDIKCSEIDDELRQTEVREPRLGMVVLVIYLLVEIGAIIYLLSRFCQNS